ncbi:MAG: HAMP domain-containing protein, partial [Spirochaetales bacterium]|nr:HAMP domain-containing protein [Spirochaetales bacterium]
MKNKNLLQRLNKNLYLTIIPVSFFFILMLVSLIYTTVSYDKIVKNITEANNYSIRFKEQIDYAMYRSIINGSLIDELQERFPNDEIVNPYEVIENTRKTFTALQSNSYTQNLAIIKIILRDLNNLEKACKKIEKNVTTPGHYTENMNLLELNVYILTELIQEQIQEYIHYEALSLNELRSKLYNFNFSLDFLYIILFIIYLAFATWYHKRMMNSITRPIKELKFAAEEIAQGNFILTTPVNYDEELAIFARSFNHATTQIQELIKKTKEEQ